MQKPIFSIDIEYKFPLQVTYPYSDLNILDGLINAALRAWKLTVFYMAKYTASFAVISIISIVC